MAIIENIDIQVIPSALKTSYELSYGVLTSYESVMATIQLADGERLFGEVTPLRGYTDETVTSVVTVLNAEVPRIIGKQSTEAIASLEGAVDKHNSFAFSAVLPPLEVHGEGNGIPEVDSADLVHGLKCEGRAVNEIGDEVDELLRQGYQTFKIKFGRDADDDLETIEKLSKLDLKRCRLRFDANCGYTYDQTLRVIESLSERLMESTEYLEQPLPKNDWTGFARLITRGTPVPVMIDESIYTEKDIARAHDIGAQFIKIKLCKFGGMAKLQRALNLAKQLEMNVVFGNGVATDIANFYELLFYYKNKKNIFGAAESVGFLKLQRNLNYDISVHYKGH